MCRAHSTGVVQRLNTMSTTGLTVQVFMFMVAGATGNVGRELGRSLAADGERVTATSRGTTAARVPDGARPVRADLTDEAGLREVLEGTDALFPGNEGASAHLIDPHAVAETTLGILGEPAEAELRPGLGVQDGLGRPPRAFADWARRHADLFR